MNPQFTRRKLSVLLKKDKSSIGKWDKPILKLCKKINQSKDYYTTSSCSGRILLMIDQEKKSKNLFLYSSHKLVTFKEIKHTLENIPKNKNIKFKLDPCIIHLACKDFECANKLLEIARNTGWKKSGILSYNKSKRIIIELNGTGKLEFPIISKNKILINDKFLKVVVNQSNQKLKHSWKLINNLEKSFS